MTNFLLASLVSVALNGGTPVVEQQRTNLKMHTIMNEIVNIPAKDQQFSDLPYGYDALEPYIDKMTMEIHHSRHHRAYYDNFMKTVAGTAMEGMTLMEIFNTMNQHPAAVRNNGGGFYNHYLFWGNMTSGGSQLTGQLKMAIETEWGSEEKFRDAFSAAAASRFGSGWAWLSLDKNGKLFISSTANQDNPLMNVEAQQGTPLLALDVWEHAYYLKYQNKRPEYIKNFWSVINWKVVEERYIRAGGR